MSSFIGAGRLLTSPRPIPLRLRSMRRAARRAARRAGIGSVRPRRRALAAVAPVLGSALVLAVAGCAGQASVRLPPKAVVVREPAGGPAGQFGPRQQVMAAYVGYWQANDSAVNAGNASRARQILSRYVPAAALPGLIAALQQDWDLHAVVDGSPVLHILSVHVHKNHATVHDCVDLSHAGLKSARTGHVLPHSFGSARANYYASLVLTGGRWLVSNLVPVVATCVP